MFPRNRRWLTTVPVLVWFVGDIMERYLSNRKERLK